MFLIMRHGSKDSDKYIYIYFAPFVSKKKYDKLNQRVHRIGEPRNRIVCIMEYDAKDTGAQGGHINILTT